MPKIMQALFVFSVINLIYIAVRGPWIFKVRNKYYQKAYAMVTSQKGEPKTQSEMDELSPYLSVYYDAIWRFPRLLFCFWKWDLSKMVSDREKFNEVANFSGEETLCTH